ncbi:MAG: beta-ketoacyl-[acyl-carrier-protein] synthase family protein [Candidatus Methylomirabilia bacterium]
MSRVWIVATAAITALGEDADTLWSGLLAGRTGIGPLTRFPTDAYKSHVAACVPGLQPQGTGSLANVLLDRLCARLPPLPPDTRLVAATTKGGVDCLERLARGLPADPDNIPLPALGAALRRRLGLTAPGFTVSAACASGSIALGRGAQLVASGAADSVLVVGFDALCEFIFSGFSALQALSHGPCMPFDGGRTGLTLGEGAAALLLCSPERARREGREPVGELLGWSASNDAVHITAPARDSRGLIQAIRAALAHAGIEPAEVGGVSAHGTGTIYNDLMELNAFRAIFGERRVPVYGVKGALGHTLGAAGAIETTIALRALDEGIVPGTVGCVVPDQAAGGMVRLEPTPLCGNRLLLTNSGFGGVNAALVLGGRPHGPRASVRG